MKSTEENTSSICVVCGESDAQWSCQQKGCNNMYHLNCVRKHQPDDFITVGRWYCVDCIKKKLQFGAVFACDDQIESIWDVKHGKAEAKYWVKYMNLAHVYNCWIPESRICQIAPELLARFIKEYQTNKGTTWKKEWTMPERLLLCRDLMHFDMAEKFFQDLGGQLQYCNTEWLVKWKGLGYEHATWELGTPKFLRSSEVRRLLQEYNCSQDDAARRAEFASRHNKEEQLYSAEMLFEPAERETATNVINAQALMPDIGISVLSRSDVCLKLSNNFLEMPPFTQEMFPNGLNLEPLANELTRINHRIKDLTKMHEEKKLKIKSQWEAEVQNAKRKYDALSKDADETFRNPEKILQCVEGSEIEERELRASEMADGNQPSAQQNPSSQFAYGFERVRINCASSELGHCTLSCQNTQAQPVETSQAPIVNLSKKKKRKRISRAPQTDVASPHTTNRVPHVPANQASTPVTTVCTGDNPASFGPHILHIWNQPTRGASTLHPFSYPHMLNPNALGMSPSTGCASSVQKTSTPVFPTRPVSPVQVPHVLYNPAPPMWTHQPRPILTSQVSPAVASMSYPHPNMVAPWPPTTSSSQQTHLHTGRSQSVMRNPTQPVSTNWAPPVHVAYHTRPPPGPRYIFNHPYMLRAPSPYMRHPQPHLSMRNPQAPQAPTIPNLSYNVSNIGGSILDPTQRSVHKS